MYIYIYREREILDSLLVLPRTCASPDAKTCERRDGKTAEAEADGTSVPRFGPRG